MKEDDYVMLRMFFWMVLYGLILGATYAIKGFEFAVLVGMFFLPLITLTLILDFALSIIKLIYKEMEKDKK